MAGTITHSWNGSILTITSDSGTSSMELRGPRGDDGPRGPMGPAGEVTSLDTSLLSNYATKQYVAANAASKDLETTIPNTYVSKEYADATYALKGEGGGSGSGTTVDLSAYLTQAKADTLYAPAGYGLGQQYSKSITDCNEAVANGWYSASSSAANCPFSTGATLLVLVRDTKYVKQIAYSNEDKNAIAMRRMYNGTWREWEYLNPNLSPDTEHRTVFRFGGRPVFMKRVYFGALPNATTKSVEHGITGRSDNIDAILTTSSNTYFVGYNKGIESISFNNSTVDIKTSTNMSAYEVYVLLIYTKNVFT